MEYLLEAVALDAAIRQLKTELEDGNGSVAVFGATESIRPAVAAVLHRSRTVLYVASSPVEATRLHGLISAYVADVQLFLPRELPLVRLESVSSERRSGRLSVLSRLALSVPSLIVTCAEALLERLAPVESFLSQLISVHYGDTVEPRVLLERLLLGGYERCSQVEASGQCAMRGDILDVYPSQSDLPYRIEFFGDEIDRIVRFDPLTQRSVESVEHVVLPPAYETPQPVEAQKRALRLLKQAEGFDAQREAWSEGRPTVTADVLLPLLHPNTVSLIDYLPKGSWILLNDPQRIADEAQAASMVFSQTLATTLERGEGHPLQEKLLGSPERLMDALDTRFSAAFYSLFRTYPTFSHHARVGFTAQAAPQFLSDLNRLSEELGELKKRNAILCYCGEASLRVQESLRASGVEAVCAERLNRPPKRGEILLLSETLPQGFVLAEAHLVVLTPMELFNKRPAAKTRKKSNPLRFSDLETGDLIVHEAHGIGRFLGVERLTAAGSTRDYLLLQYRGEDRLYIPTDQLDRIQKYIGGGEEHPPALSKLGGTEWQQRVTKARQGAKKLAVDLARLYAERTQRGGFAFSPDTEWQKRLEQSFPFEETPDQAAAISDVKRDMEAPRPMDRLLCGDVGYGKTEVAIRAAFKAVQDGKQVAILVPTTILAQQHYHSVLTRLQDFPVRIGCLSRFRTAKEQETVKKGLRSGEIDIVIGTHALLSKSVSFRDLGLLIIDEEHRFGVNHKEQIKALRNEIDVLTLTATPIPRTLNLSLSGIRDISLIETPPENRFPVQTFVLEYADALVASALNRELARGGQAFIVSNRVSGMERTLAHFRELLPEARIEMAHGQMPETQLENTMLAFLRQEIDILLCSTIVESGVDIPNANTLIVLEADKLGLAQLYQLRGRVGRSTRMAYAYLTVAQARAVSEQGQKRLMAIKEFTQFGAGFRLAMRDLEIRGAGSLLGAHQHGHIADVGYEYYCKMIRDAVREANGERLMPRLETTVDLPGDAFIPQTFLPEEVHRLAMYKRISEIDDKDGYTELLDEFIDRYGDLPEPVLHLMELALIRAYARRAGLESVTWSKGCVRMQYAAGVQPDGMRLIACLMQEKDVRLLAKEPPCIEWKWKKEETHTIFKKLPQFLHTLMHCVSEEDGV